ncbi:RNI-like protein [Laetiporus sulphureus 93-53]|uniref:RNI-like protein n=1 Tax=Laetiporus sulphureus 93-53 TaxID=1314785 RepID=A0A165EH80_9APHY|nr:RNI-like protein [Laetiporus sulphureus 93-53]KZT07047.1 RNI-like protein [Laetiporus sulphureus 93-53]
MRRMSAVKVPFSVRSHIESLDAGLSSVNGALEVIDMIRSRQRVTKLILGHNDLGDDGCVVLFGFLNSQKGRRYPISEISLNSNRIGDRGLQAIGEYLKDNTTLKELFLQNNVFRGNPSVVSAFTAALNSSYLETLSLTTNHDLSDAFIAQFLPNMDAPYLGEIHLSVLGITPTSVPHIVDYISSSRCRVHTLKMNGNRLGIRGAWAIIRAIQRHNFTLTKLELYANGLADADASSETTASEDDGGGRGLWQDKEKELGRLLHRNRQLKEATEREAFALLRHARAVLLRSKYNASSMALVPRPAPNESILSSIGVPIVLTQPAPPPFPFTRLPIELQLHILSFLAPTLSTAQHIRICTFAASPGTLPPLLPNLSPRDYSFGSSISALGFGAGVGMMPRKRAGASVGPGSISGKVASPGDHRRAEERAKWLIRMRCNAFELEEDGVWAQMHELAE